MSNFQCQREKQTSTRVSTTAFTALTEKEEFPSHSPSAVVLSFSTSHTHTHTALLLIIYSLS